MLRILSHALIIEVQARHRVVALRVCGLLLNGDHIVVLIKLHHAKALGIVNSVAKHSRACLGGIFHCPAQVSAESIAVEDIVTEHERAGTARNEVLPIVEGPCKSVRLWLNHVLQRDAKLASVTQQTLKVRCVLRSRNNEDVAYARQHECAQGVVHHGLIIHRQELFACHGRQRVEACATSSREDDSPHCSSLQSEGAHSSANTGGRLSDKDMLRHTPLASLGYQNHANRLNDQL